nr:hypothetical protein Iba_chr02bCG12090 [Ipomoea batatas]
MLSTAFSGRGDHLWRQQHEARGLKISPSNGNPPSMYKSRSDMDISPEERFSEDVKYIFSPFPVSWSVNEFASKIDVVTPLDLIINYAIPQRGKDVRGSWGTFSSHAIAMVASVALFYEIRRLLKMKRKLIRLFSFVHFDKLHKHPIAFSTFEDDGGLWHSTWKDFIFAAL